MLKDLDTHFFRLRLNTFQCNYRNQVIATDVFLCVASQDLVLLLHKEQHISEYFSLCYTCENLVLNSRHRLIGSGMKQVPNGMNHCHEALFILTKSYDENLPKELPRVTGNICVIVICNVFPEALQSQILLFSICYGC